MAKGVRVGGPLGPFRDGAEQALRALEYSEGRVGHLLLVMAHLSRWLDECGLGVADLTSEAVEQFFVTFRAHHRWCRSSRSLRPVLEHLGAIGVVPTAEVDPEQTTEEELLVSFAHYLRDQRGLTEQTVEAYQNYARICLRAWWPEGEVAPAELGAADVIAVVRSGVDTMRPPSLRCMVTSLRSLLRFFHATGRTSRSLVGAVPAMASWPRTVLPAPVSADTAARLIASCKTATVAGRRDAAVLTMLIRLGLRARRDRGADPRRRRLEGGRAEHQGQGRTGRPPALAHRRGRVARHLSAPRTTSVTAPGAVLEGDGALRTIHIGNRRRRRCNGL